MQETINVFLLDVRSALRFRWHGMALAWGLGLAGAAYVLLQPDTYEGSARVFVDTSSALEPFLEMVRAGYQPPAPPEIRVLGDQFFAGAKLAIHMLRRGEYITEYDAVVARKLAMILSGGALSAPQSVSEQYLLDLEREAFLSLCGNPKTQERMGYMLKTGKRLRN